MQKHWGQVLSYGQMGFDKMEIRFCMGSWHGPCAWRTLHVTARRNERREIFRDETDGFHFLELLSDWFTLPHGKSVCLSALV